MFSLVEVKNPQIIRGERERVFQQDGAQSPLPVTPAPSVGCTKIGTTCNSRVGWQKSSRDAAGVTPRGMQEPMARRSIPAHPRVAAGEHPWLRPRCEQTDIISPPEARGELGMLGEGPASWETLLRAPSDSCDSCGRQKKNGSGRKRSGKESVAIFNH